MIPHFPLECHEEGTATQALSLHLMIGVPGLGDGVASMRDSLGIKRILLTK